MEQTNTEYYGQHMQIVEWKIMEGKKPETPSLLLPPRLKPTLFPLANYLLS